MTRRGRAAGALAGAILSLALSPACAFDANNCQRQLDLCLRRSPPGASTSDCYAQYDACTRMPRKGQQGGPAAQADDDALEDEP